MNRLFTKIGRLIAVLVLSVICAHQSSALGVGDVVFTSFDTKGTAASDTFSFVLLVPIPNGTSIGFTDRGWNGSTWNTDNGTSETSLVWTSGSIIPAGTEIMIVGTTAYNVSTGLQTGSIGSNTSTLGAGQGISLAALDQIIAYQGTLGGTVTVLAGLHWQTCSGYTGEDANWDAGGSCTITGTGTSAMPPGLSPYTGPTTGAMWTGNGGAGQVYAGRFVCTNGAPFANASAARNAILNRANWTFITNNASPFAVPAGCNFIGVAPPAITSDPTAKTVCAGTNSTTFSVSASGTSLTYQWQVSTTGTGGTYANVSGANYSGNTTATLTVSNAPATFNGYAYQAVVTNSSGSVNSAGAVLTVDNGVPTIGAQPSDATICPNGTAILSASATGGAITYKWQVSTNGSGSFTNITDGGVYSNSGTSSLTIIGAPANMYGYQYRLSATNTCGTSYSNAASLTFRTNWTGATSTNWNISTNWSCNVVPDVNTDVVIPNVTNKPIVSTTTATAHDITINPGSSLTVAASSTLTVAGDVISLGTFNSNATGATTTFSSAAAQSVPGGSYYNINIAGAGDKTLSGTVTVSNLVTFSASGKLFLGGNNLVVDGTGFSGVSTSSYVVTDGNGSVKKNNLSAAFLFPIGTGTDYTPATLSNSGTVDNFTARVIDGVYNSYIGETPQGAPISSKVVNKTWFVTEDIAGGSNATLITQWNAADELTSFNRTAVTLSHYTGGRWLGMAFKAATVNGSTYSVDRTGITSFSPFGVGTIGSPLPVKLISFEGNQAKDGVMLSWKTAEEKDLSSFGIERSYDGRQFSNIGNVPAANKDAYQFLDSKAESNAARLFYRLNMMDDNGAQNYSSTITITQSGNKESYYQVSPNPLSGDDLYIRTMNAPEGSLELSVTDVAGKVWYRQTIENAAGNALLPVSMKSVPAGIYLLRLTNSTATETVKIEKR